MLTFDALNVLIVVYLLNTDREAKVKRQLSFDNQWRVSLRDFRCKTRNDLYCVIF